MAPGVITVSSVADNTPVRGTTTTWGINNPVALQRRVQLTPQPVHMYYQLKACKVFDCNSFFNQERFTIAYDDEHILLPNCVNSHLMMYHASMDDGVVTVDSKTLPVYTCFKICLTTSCMSLNVGPHTPLSLLLNCAQLDIVQIMLTLKQVIEICDPINNVRYTVNALSDAVWGSKRSYHQYCINQPKRTRQEDDRPPLPTTPPIPPPIPPPPPPPPPPPKPTRMFNSYSPEFPPS